LSPSDKSKVIPLFWLFFMGLEDRFAQRATIKRELAGRTPHFVLNFLFLYLPEFLFNPSNAKLNPICHLLALLGARHILHVSRIRVNTTENSRGSSAPFVKNHKWQLNGSYSSGIWPYSSRTLLYPVEGFASLYSTDTFT
jgi:hypothetical protein